MKRLGDPALLRELMDPSTPRRLRLKAVVSVAALTVLVLALAGPRWGQNYREVRRKGSDVVVAVDLSASMLAEDIAPNRLTQAKRELGLLIEGLEGDRVGLVAFAGTAFLQCPLTLDRGAARSLLDLFEPDLIPAPGTDLAAALTTSLEAFPSGDSGYKAVVLLTDGEDHSGRLDAAVRRAVDDGAKIFPIGFGSPTGEVIPLRDAQGKVTDYKKDKNGKTVVSKMNEAALQDMADKTGGVYHRASNGEVEVDRLLDEIRGMKKKTLEDRMADHLRDRVAGPLAAALVLLLLEFLWPERSGHFRRLRWKAIAPSLLILFMPVIAGAMGRSPGVSEKVVRAWRERAEKNPQDPDAQWNLGQALFRNGDGAGAAQAFDRAKALFTDPMKKSAAAYNEGNALALAKKSDEALERYKEAMRLAPDDLDAKHNFEVLSRQEKKKGGGKGEKKEKKKQNSGADKKEASAAPQKPGTLSKEDAERILQAVARQEKEARRKVKMPPSKPRSEEDW